MTAPSLRRILAPVLASLAALVAVPAAALAATPGLYDVTVGATTGYPGWSASGGGGPMTTTNMRVGAGLGTYQAGAYRRWRLDMPHHSVRIATGRMAYRAYTPDPAVIAQIREGSAGGAIRVIGNQRENGSFASSLVGDGAWVDFGLFTTTATTLTSGEGAYMAVASLTLTLRDIVEPAVALVAVPDADGWYGTGCAPYTFSATDLGSGLAREELYNETTATLVTSWSHAPLTGLRQGPTTSTREGCITGSAQQHGTNVMRARAYDASGLSHEHLFRVRVDLHGPVVTTALADADAFTSPRPVASFVVGDPDSGLAAVSLSIDGQAAPLVQDQSRYTIALDRNLSVGYHEVELRAVDNVGNVTIERRRISVGDVTPPTVTLTSPGASGDASPWISASATDDGSELDAATWSVRVNGVQLPVGLAGTGIAGPVGLLTSGVHTFEVAVSDAQGNRAVLVHRYTVDGAAAGALAIGGGSGIYLQSAPRAAVNYGATTTITATAAEHGRPLALHRMVATQWGVQVASELTDAHGSAALRFTALRSGPVQLTLSGTILPAATVELRVRPIVTLRASNYAPRRGQVVTLSGRVRPGLRGRRVVLQGRIGGTWVSLRKAAVVGAHGRFSTTVASAVPGAVAVRMRLPGTAAWANTYSNAVVLHVRR